MIVSPLYPSLPKPFTQEEKVEMTREEVGAGSWAELTPIEQQLLVQQDLWKWEVKEEKERLRVAAAAAAMAAAEKGEGEDVEETEEEEDDRPMNRSRARAIKAMKKKTK